MTIARHYCPKCKRWYEFNEYKCSPVRHCLKCETRFADVPPCMRGKYVRKCKRRASDIPFVYINIADRDKP